MALLLLTACHPSRPVSGDAATAPEEDLNVPECVVTSVPDSLGYDKFYTKYVDVNGLPLISSWRVPDSAFTAAQNDYS